VECKADCSGTLDTVALIRIDTDATRGFDQRIRSEDSTRGFDQRIRSEDSIRGFDQMIRPEDSIRGFDQRIRPEDSTRGFDQRIRGFDQRIQCGDSAGDGPLQNFRWGMAHAYVPQYSDNYYCISGKVIPTQWHD